MPYGGNPGTVPADMVRFLLGDTDPDAPIVADAEVVAALAQHGNLPYAAAAWIADALSARFSSIEGFSIDGVRLEGGADQGKVYSSLALRLRADALRVGETVPAGFTGSTAIVVTGLAQSRPAFIRTNEAELNPASLGFPSW